MLYKYIFYKVYFFYVKAFKEREIPHWFASSVIALIMVANIIVVTDSLLYYTNPEIIKSINIYYKYFALFVLVCVMWFVNNKKTHIRIIDSCEKLPKSKKKVLGYLSILYVIMVFVGFFWIGALIREYNITH